MITANVGDTVRSLVTEHDVVAGKEYPVTQVVVANSVIRVRDDIGEDYALTTNEYVVTSRKGGNPDIRDIRGNALHVRDIVAYASGGTSSYHLTLFEVLEINTPTALCRSLAGGPAITLGVFEERAIIVK